MTTGDAIFALQLCTALQDLGDLRPVPQLDLLPGQPGPASIDGLRVDFFKQEEGVGDGGGLKNVC